MQPGTALLLLMAATLVSVQGVPLSAWTSGTASFFGGPQDSNSNAYKLTIDSGSCGYGDFDPRLYPLYHVVGLHKSNTLVANRPMDACGSCLEIQCVGDEKHCNSKQIIPMIITDQCAYNCDSTTINIHVFGFEEVAPLKLGRTQVRYRLVECEPTDPVTVHIMDYRANEGGWIRLALKNVAGDAALIKVELAAASQHNESGDPSAAGWMPFTNTYGAVWEAGIGGVTLPTPPLDLRITNSIGQQLIIKKFVSTAGMVGDVETTGQFPSPFGPSAATSSGNDFVPPTLKAVQPITVGTAIDNPRNTLYLSAMNATGPVDVPMPQQSKGTTTSPVNAGEDKPYPGGAAPTNNIVLSGNQASQGPPAQPTQSPNKTPPAQVPTNQQVPAPSPVHVPAPNNPASPPQRTPVPKPLPTFVSAAPGQHTSPRPSPVTAEPTYHAPSSVKEGAPGNTKQVVIARNGGTRRLLKV